MFDKNFCVILESKKLNFEYMLKDILKLKNAFEDSLDSRLVRLYAQDFYNFLTSFFALLMLKKNVVILQNEDDKVLINDKFIESILDSNINDNGILPNFNNILESRFYMQTSGSTKVKYIQKNVSQMLYEAQTLASEFNITNNDFFISSISHNHLYGLTFNVFLPLVCGCSVYAKRLNYPEYLLETLNIFNNKSPILLSSPTLLNTICQYKNNLWNLKCIFSAGSKLPDNTKQNLKVKKIIEIYGSTESGVIAKNEDDSFITFKNVDISLNKDSLLCITSPWCNSEQMCDINLDSIESKKVDSNIHSFQSNDIAEIEALSNNRFKINLLGRFDRILKLHDKRVNLDFIQNKLKENPFIKDCYIAKNNKFDRLSALIVLSNKGEKYFVKNGKKGIVNNLKAFLKKDFGSIVRYFTITHKIPYNSQGKVTNDEFLKAINKKTTPHFKIINKDSNSLSASGFISVDLFYFNGHFPSFPLVPGFIEIGFIYELLESLDIKKEDIVQIESCKFNTFLQPLELVNINLEIKNDKLYFTLKSSEKIFASGRMILKQ